jgi:hypothetical protein
VTLDLESSPVFREQARAWLTLHPRLEDRNPQVLTLGDQVAVVADFVDCPANFLFREPLLVRGNFQCGPGSRFEAPVYVGGNCVVGKNSTLAALCVEGDCVVGLNARVDTWVDAAGTLDLRAGSWVGEVAMSERAIQLSLEAGAAQLFAPEVQTHGHFGGIAESPLFRGLLEVPLPSVVDTPEFGAVRGFRPDKLMPLGADTWVYDGSLTLPSPVWIKSKLVVRGSFTCPAGSLIEDDVKCGGSLHIGGGSVARGKLTARGELTLDPDCLFEGSLSAGLGLRLSTGVRGFCQGAPVEVFSAERVILEPNVIVRGHVAGGQGAWAAQPVVEGGLDLLLAEG